MSSTPAARVSPLYLATFVVGLVMMVLPFILGREKQALADHPALAVIIGFVGFFLFVLGGRLCYPTAEKHGNLFHHFDRPSQQFDSGKMGTWLFLVTEVLFFSGLFCAYVVYRNMHPEYFIYGHLYLDKIMGAINTCVLLFSSLTMAWGVRCAQLGQRKGLIVCLILTILCAFGFMGIKYAEYSHKVHDGLLWGAKFQPSTEALIHAYEHRKHAHGAAAFTKAEEAKVPARDAMIKAWGEEKDVEKKKVLDEALKKELSFDKPEHASIFFSIYFCMTGLHGIHVLVGIVLLGWLLAGAVKGVYGPETFGPVDFVGLYWHIVDLVWIYLFPMLYLIH